jgi:hypothetical protein
MEFMNPLASSLAIIDETLSWTLLSYPRYLVYDVIFANRSMQGIYA